MDQLQKAAELLMGTPDQVTAIERQAAEQIFMQFRSTANPFQLCREILETSTNEYLLYEAAAVLRANVIREYSVLPKEDMNALGQYTLNYILTKHNIPYFARETLIQVISIMVKRTFIEEETEELAILEVVENIITTGNGAMKMIGCSIVMGLFQEFSITIKSTDVGLPWECHFQAKRKFENNGLKRIFTFVTKLLSELANADQDITPDLRAIIGRLVTVAESTLTWSFIPVHLPKKLLYLFEHDLAPSFKPTTSWKPLFEDNTIIQLFFKLYWKLRDDWEISHHLMNCLIQLSSFSGRCRINQQKGVSYLTHYLECLIGFLNSTSVKEVEAVGISSIFRKIILYFPLRLINKVPSELFEQFASHLETLACQFAEGAAAEEHTDPEEQMYMEAFDMMLTTWCILLREQHCPEILKTKAITIFDVYLKCHLSAPHGKRLPLKNEEVFDDTRDRVLFREQLSSVNICGQQAAGYSLSILTQLLEEKLDAFRQMLSQAVAAGLNASSNMEPFEAIYEDIHWLLLISASLLSSPIDSECRSIPEEIMRHSIEKSATVDHTATSTLLANPAKSPSEIANIDKTDPIVRLFASVLRLCETESQAMEANMCYMISPEVSCSLMWFLNKFSSIYLFHDEESHRQISVPISNFFGTDSEGGRWILDYLLRFIGKTLKHRCAEKDLSEDTVALLNTLASQKSRGSYLIQSNGISDLIDLLKSGHLIQVSSTAQKGLLQGLVLCVSGLPNVEDREPYWNNIIDKPVIDFQQLVMNENFPKVFADDRSIKIKIFHFIDHFTGIVKGATMWTTTETFERIKQVLPGCGRIVDICHNYADVVESILQFYVDCEHSLLSFLRTPDSIIFYQAIIEIIQAYAKHNIGKRVLQIQEEDQMRDLQLMMELLSSILSKDFIDLACPVPNEEEVSVADVSLFGLRIIMPLMSAELLKIPTLSLKYYRMISFITEMYPRKVCGLDAELLKNMLGSVELGLTAFGSDIGLLCFELVHIMGSSLFLIKRDEPDSPHLGAVEKIRPFLKMILGLLLTGQVNSDLNSVASFALYALISLFIEDFPSLVTEMISSENDIVKKQRLTSAFTELMKDIEFNGTRIQRMAFKEKCEYFINSVKAFMCVK